MAHLLKKRKKPSCIALNDVFDKDINLLLPDVAKQDQSGKVSSAANGIAIFEEVNKETMSGEELGPAISQQIGLGGNEILV